MSTSARLTALLLALAAAATLAAHVDLGLARHPGRTLGYELWRTARYFTILTLALSAAVYGLAALRGLGAAAAGGVTLWLAIVGVVYHLLLARDLSGARYWIDHAMHSAVPLAAGLWWLTLAPKAGLRRAHALWWLAWPGIYAAYALARGALDGRHPYFFLDPGRIGWAGVALWIAGLALVFWLAGRGLVALGGVLARRPDSPTAARDPA